MKTCLDRGPLPMILNLYIVHIVGLCNQLIVLVLVPFSLLPFVTLIAAWFKLDGRVFGAGTVSSDVFLQILAQCGCDPDSGFWAPPGYNKKSYLVSGICIKFPSNHCTKLVFHRIRCINTWVRVMRKRRIWIFLYCPLFSPLL